ncbi:MAG TPA: hypothetical protein VHM88_01425 [Candidatus Acidoferrales bacterium]|jgi:hypothetical protein|nr:hypothetical protein [Candidatus Acidoferrales bacterium]
MRRKVEILLKNADGTVVQHSVYEYNTLPEATAGYFAASNAAAEKEPDAAAEKEPED